MSSALHTLANAKLTIVLHEQRSQGRDQLEGVANKQLHLTGILLGHLNKLDTLPKLTRLTRSDQQFGKDLTRKDVAQAQQNGRVKPQPARLGFKTLPQQLLDTGRAVVVVQATSSKLSLHLSVDTVELRAESSVPRRSLASQPSLWRKVDENVTNKDKT